jgi:selenocysteine-specific elongation factor
MRSLVVGTAGHIDHGKSALVLALTGTDPDRLKEEKERGITIDLGFAHAVLGGEAVASFIDVPGHERFVRNMLAGSHGIDAVLLVVAADESVMPQTREHFEICRLLAIPRGIVALTKCDLADPESQALAEMEVRELVAGTFLEGAPVLRVSARTGAGLDALAKALLDLARATPPRPSGGPLRLPVDRVFTMRGFGTVVTGTVVCGALAVGDELQVLPSGKRTRVRGLQVHGGAVERVEAGSRAAVNLASLETSDLHRGDVLARPGTLRATSIADVEVTLLPGANPLPDQSRVRVHVASAEVLARVRLLGAAAVAPGASAPAQLRLESAAVLARGDRLVLRSPSPARTIGGARVLDPLPPKRARAQVDRVRALAAAAAPEAAALMVAEAGPAGVDAPLLAARLGLDRGALAALLSGRGDVVPFGPGPEAYVSSEAIAALGRATVAALEAFHSASPLKPAMAREELRRRVFLRTPEGVFERVLSSLAEARKLKPGMDAVALTGHEVRYTPDEEAARSRLVEAAEVAGLSGVEVEALASASRLDRGLLDRVGRSLLAEGTLQRVGETLLVHRDRLETLKQDVRRRWPPGARLDVAGFKEMTGLTRKWVIPLLEYLDRERVTRRAGADRLVLGPPATGSRGAA